MFLSPYVMVTISNAEKHLHSFAYVPINSHRKFPPPEYSPRCATLVELEEKMILPPQVSGDSIALSLFAGSLVSWMDAWLCGSGQTVIPNYLDLHCAAVLSTHHHPSLHRMFLP